MTERGSRGSLKRSRNLEGETNACSKLQVRDNSVLTAGDVPAAATVITVPISAASRKDGDRAGSNSPAAKECRITRNRWSRDGIKSNVQKKHQDEVKGFSEHLLLGRSNSRASSSYFFLFFSAYSYFSYFLAISSYFSYFLAILLTISKYLLEI